MWIAERVSLAWKDGWVGMAQQIVLVITSISPSDRRCCSWRTFPDNNLYRGKCARSTIVDRWPVSQWEGGHGQTTCAVITTMSPSDRRCCFRRTFPDNNLYRESASGAELLIAGTFPMHPYPHDCLLHCPAIPPPFPPSHPGPSLTSDSHMQLQNVKVLHIAPCGPQRA